MLILKAVVAYTALNQLMEQEMDYKTAHALVLLKSRLQPHVEFYDKEEANLVLRYGKKNDNGGVDLKENGAFLIETVKEAEEFRKKQQELDTVDIQEEWEKIKCPCPEKIKPAVLEALQDFIEFGGD